MGKHNKKRKRGVKYFVFNVRVNEVEWQFLQSLKDKGISMSEYVRTTMKTTPRYQDYVKLLYGNHKDEYLKTLPSRNTKPSLPTDSWNSVSVEGNILEEMGISGTSVIGCTLNDILETHKLVPGDVNSNRQTNKDLHRERVTLSSTSGSVENIIQNKSKIDKRYE